MKDSARIARPNAIRKAAILISTLDTRMADELLDRMAPAEAAQVREAAMELREINDQEQDEVLREFIGSGMSAPPTADGGVELDPSLAMKLTSPGGYEPPRPEKRKTAPFESLWEAGVDALVRQLERQHPQLVAVVVAHLAPERAAAIIERLAPRFQADVLRRVAELDATDPEVIRDIEQELEQLLSNEIRAARNRNAGLSTVSAILDAAGKNRSDLLKNLSRHERELAGMLDTPTSSSHTAEDFVEPKIYTGSDRLLKRSNLPKAARTTSEKSSSVGRTKPIAPAEESIPAAKGMSQTARFELPNSGRESSLQFDDLAKLSDNDWAELIRAADANIVLLALTGASDAMLARVTRQLTSRESEALRSRLEQVGPIRLADIDIAQRRLAEVASELADQGRIQINQRVFAAAA